MIKKVIHIADIHLRTFKMHKEYREILTDFLNIAKDKVKVKGYDKGEVRIVIAGDLVHQKITISNEQILLLTWFLKECIKLAPVVIIAGNHDLLENNKDRLDSITPLIELIDSHEISYLKESKCYVDDDIVWSVYSIFEENVRPNIEASRKFLSGGGHKTYIGLYHAPIMGATTDIGYEFEHSTSLEHFDGCDIVMMGDIHKRQEFKYKGIPIAYSSSLIQQNFGESIQKHGFLLWDVATRTYEECDIATNYGFYQFKITSLDDLENNKEKLMNG